MVVAQKEVIHSKDFTQAALSMLGNHYLVRLQCYYDACGKSKTKAKRPVISSPSANKSEKTQGKLDCQR